MQFRIPFSELHVSDGACKLASGVAECDIFTKLAVFAGLTCGARGRAWDRLTRQHRQPQLGADPKLFDSEGGTGWGVGISSAAGWKPGIRMGIEK